MSHKSTKHIPYCLNCHYPLAEFDSFCPNCGQKPTDGKTTMHHLMHEFTHTLFHVDGKLVSTLRHLFVPGKLTEEFFKGHHKRYAHPIQLYLVLGAAFLFCLSVYTHRVEEQVQKQLDSADQTVKQRLFLASVDSTAQAMASYKNNPSVQKAVDSLVQKKYADINHKESSDLEAKFIIMKRRSIRKRLALALLLSKKDSVDVPKQAAYKAEIAEMQAEIAKFGKDSVDIVTSYAVQKNTNPNNALRLLNIQMTSRWTAKGFNISMNGKSVFASDTVTEFTKQLESDFKSEVQKDITDKIADLPSDYSAKAKGFLNGVTEDFQKGKADNRRNEGLEQSKQPPRNALKPDSIGVASTSIAVSDIQELTADEILEKYHIEGFWKRRLLSRVIEFRQGGAEMLHGLFSKMLWIITFSLLPTAGLLWLMYRRRGRFFVEHLVWLLHINCLFFILFPMVILSEYLGFSTVIIYLLVVIFAPLFALKRYYKQDWGKTMVKFVIYSFGYNIIGALVFVIGSFLSFLFL